MPAHSCLIAVVEDDASVRRAIVRLLRASGFEAQTFASAEEFLASPAPETWPCLIFDLQLPGMSGFELLAHLQTFAPRRAAIFVTAQDDDKVEEQAARFPGSVLLRKPFIGIELLAAVQVQLQRRGFPAEPET